MTTALAKGMSPEDHRRMASTVVIICFAALGLATIAQFIYAIWEYESHHHDSRGERRSQR